MNQVQYFLRRSAQRWLSRLPRKSATFRAFTSNCREIDSLSSGIDAIDALLLSEPGERFEVAPTVFADGKPGALAGENQPYSTKSPTREVYALSNACVHGPSGIVYDPASRVIVAETLEHWETHSERHPVYATPRYPAAKRLTGTSFLLAGLAGQTFYHFLIEILPKLALVRPLLPRIDQLLVSRYIEQAKMRWLQRAVEPKRIIWIEELGHFHCDQLIFTNRLVAHFEPNPWAVRSIRSLLNVPAEVGRPSEVLWLDRTRERNRAVAWEDEFRDQLGGVTPVDFSTLTPELTIARCGSARALIGLHGAALANMVFCQPGTKIIELATRPFHPWYPRLAQVCGLSHTTIRVGDSEPDRQSAVDVARRLLRE